MSLVDSTGSPINGNRTSHAEHLREQKIHGDCVECQKQMVDYGKQQKDNSKQPTKVKEQAPLPTLTDESILCVSCLACGAEAGSLCTTIRLNESKHALQHFHQVRRMAAYRKLMGDALPKGAMDDTQKAMICYYAFVILCDSCSQKSPAMFNGTKLSSRDIQSFFINAAISELRRDGLV